MTLNDYTNGHLTIKNEGLTCVHHETCGCIANAMANILSNTAHDWTPRVSKKFGGQDSPIRNEAGFLTLPPCDTHCGRLPFGTKISRSCWMIGFGAWVSYLSLKIIQKKTTGFHHHFSLGKFYLILMILPVLIFGGLQGRKRFNSHSHVLKLDWQVLYFLPSGKLT